MHGNPGNINIIVKYKGSSLINKYKYENEGPGVNPQLIGVILSTILPLNGLSFVSIILGVSGDKC